jgi:Holliday junction resolvase RusA-like endonuclease
MIRLNIKPLSVNDAWRGRRFKSVKYSNYEKKTLLILPKISIVSGKKTLFVNVGFSSKASDVDNVLKPFIDILQKKYKFNDSAIYKIVIEKEIVKKGSEFIEFKITSYEK